MERLTKRRTTTTEMSCAACLGKCVHCDSEDCLREAISRLATIEDILGDNYDLDELRELVEAHKIGRCVVFPDDGMLYYLEEAIDGSEKWVANKPIKNVFIQVGWGIASLSYSLFDIGKKAFFKRSDAENALAELLRREHNELHLQRSFATSTRA